MSQQSQSVHKKTKHTEQNTEQTVLAQAQRRKLRKKTREQEKRKETSSKLQKNTAKAEKRNSFTSVALPTTRCRRKNRRKIKKSPKNRKR